MSDLEHHYEPHRFISPMGFHKVTMHKYAICDDNIVKKRQYNIQYNIQFKNKSKTREEEKKKITCIECKKILALRKLLRK